MANLAVERGLFLGKRDQSFKDLIEGILKMGEMKQKYINILLDSKSLSYFSTAFTHPSADSENNYEFLETLGDSTLNKSVLWYLSRRFPQINCPEGKDIITKLKIKIIQAKSFASIAENLGFWEFITMDAKTRSSVVQKMKILEDVFEAFFGTVELVLDTKIDLGIGYIFAYRIISKLLDTINISLKYEDLVDPKTRLKELFDYYKLRGIGKLEYVKLPAQEDADDKIFNVVAKHVYPNGQSRILGKGSGYTIAEAEQQASEIALEQLRKEGITRPIPAEYIKFCI
jgi:dsRNA-specific ribonuclease